MEASPTSPDALGAMVKNDLAKWGPIIKAVIKN
jgi:hypothetical protein